MDRGRERLAEAAERRPREALVGLGSGESPKVSEHRGYTSGKRSRRLYAAR